jgi:hypothetical protein
MPKFKSDITWTSGQEVTADLLQAMVFNDMAINEEKLECKIQNVDPSTKQVRNKKWVINNAAIFAREITVTPGADLAYDEDGHPYFTKTYSFPSNNYWDGNYLPIVVLTPVGNPTLGQTVVLSSVSPSQITYRVYVLNKQNLANDRQFRIGIFAIGVKPNDSNLDGDADPSP